MKEKLFVVWIEGLSLKSGEKIKEVTPDGFKYTQSMQKALRVRQSDIEAFTELCRENGVSEWVLNSGNTFCETNYAKPNTIWIK